MEINILLALGLIFIVILVGLSDVLVNPAAYLDAPSFLIVVGLSMSALLISSSFSKFKIFLKTGKMIIMPKKQMAPQDAIDELVRLAKISKSQGRVALNKEVETITQPFLKFGVQLLTEKTGHAFIKATLENDIEEMENRHGSIHAMYGNMAGFGPVFGMVGTIVGLIQLLKGLSDASKIGPAMAVALITTLYGGFISGVIFTPAKEKLKEMSENEASLKRLIMQGILMIEKEEIPSKVEKFLKSFLQDKEKHAPKKVK
ncbi:MAG: MotA/TolQ/ExbB proton channel family protein [Candidatus Margulisbacteria bacterium]|nr:MotA/TolQ/ExbB proton channel family protein [Candidatus Margulisiibacteriota bacterium]